MNTRPPSHDSIPVVDEHWRPAPPLPPPERRGAGVGLLLITVHNVMLAIFMIGQSIAPVAWEEIIVPWHVTFMRAESKAAEPIAEYAERREELDELERDRARYRQWRWLHLGALIASVVVGVALIQFSLTTASGDFSTPYASLLLGLAAFILLVELGLGWGSRLSILFALSTGTQIALIWIPAFQRHLAGGVDEPTPESDRPANSVGGKTSLD